MNFNDGQTAVFLKDLTGREYPAIAEVNRKKRVNGQRELSLSFMYTEINKDFIYDLEFGWKVLFKGEEYTITHTGNVANGDYLLIDVTAVLSFFVDLNGYYLQDSVENQSFTPANYFNNLFQGTPYSYVLVDPLPANTLNYQDNQSKTERFLYGIDRFGGEFTIRGRVAYIYEQVGNDKDVILHEDLNVNDVRIDVDASGFHTWAKGYGDLDEETGEYKLEVEYISPLAEKYGMIEGPAIKDGNFKHADALTNAVKKQVENSYTISTEVHAVDLTNNGYPEMILEEGDRIFLEIDRLKLNQQTRVMEIEELFDWEGNIIDASYVVGNEGIATRYKTQQYDSIRDFRDITTGRKKLEYNWLPDAVRRASDIINGNLDSHFYYGVGEIIGINKDNPNGYMRFNTDGLGFSRDGGKTYQSAITYEGIVADAITTGTLRSILIESVDIYGSRFISEVSPIEYTKIEGAYIESRGNFTRTWRGQTNNHDVVLRLTNGYFQARNVSDNQSLYFTDFGISTYNDATGEVGASGSILFRDTTYSSAGSLLLHSHDGAVAMRSEKNRVVLDANQTVSIESDEASVYLRPMRDNRPGTNDFRFWVKDNPSYNETDGVLSYGTPGVGQSSGLRFKKNISGDPIVYVTNGNGDIGTGKMHGDSFLGDVEAQNNSIYLRVNDIVRVTDKNGYNGGNFNLRDFQAQHIRSNTIRVNDSGADFYIGTSSGEVRITNNEMGWSDPISYRPIRASDFHNASSLTLKTNISDLTVSGLEVINNLQVKEYIYQSDVDNGNYNHWQVGVISELSPEIATPDLLAVNHNKWLGYLTKALQEEYQARKALEQRVEDLEVLMEVI